MITIKEFIATSIICLGIGIPLSFATESVERLHNMFDLLIVIGVANLFAAGLKYVWDNWL